MRRSSKLFVAGIILIIFIPSISYDHAWSVGSSYSEESLAIVNAENFLVNQYNSSIGLLSEYPNSTTFWLYSDNYLALLAFHVGNSSDIAHQSSLMNNVSSTLARYMSKLPDAENQYMVLNSNVSYFDNSSNYEVSATQGSTINLTLNNGTTPLDPNNYGDIAFLEALYYHRIGNNSEAASLFQIGTSMYNGIGINDTAFQQSPSRLQYQTYKLALYLYTAAILGESYPSSLEATILEMQNSTNGGFYTGYYSNYSTGDTTQNVETTSLCILALAALSNTLQNTTSTTTSSASISSSTTTNSSTTTETSTQSTTRTSSTNPPTTIYLSLDLVGIAVIVLLITAIGLIFVKRRRSK